MPVFKYQARARDGKTLIKKSIEANNYADVYDTLIQNGLIPVKITQLEKSQERQKTKKLTLREVALFCRQFSTMLSAGVTLVKAFDIMRSQAKSAGAKNEAQIYDNVYNGIQKGQSLYEAMVSEGNVFPPMLVNMVRAGEVSGSLDNVMERTAQYFFSQNTLRNKIKTGTTYPKILGILTVTIVVFLFSVVLPKFFAVFDEMQIELPMITKVVIKISGFMVNQWYIILAVGFAIVLVVNVLLANPKIAYKFDEFKTRLVVVKVAVSKVAIANFTSTMGVLYASGVDMLECIYISMAVLNNRYYEAKFEKVISAVESGQMLSLSMEEQQIFEPMVASMLYIGEESGNLEQILEKTSEFYQNEAEEAIAKMIAVMEPIMIIVIGVIVLGLVASVMLPSFSLATGIASKR